MKYNTQRDGLKISEYGRNIQHLVDHCLTIEDDEIRQHVAEGIIEIMGQLNPGLRNVEDFRHKLWDHLFIISDFKLDVKSPYPIPSREIIEKHPPKLEYPQTKIRYRNYGKHLLDMIEKAKGMEDKEKQTAYAGIIASFMKLLYKNFNNRDTATDEQVKEDLRKMSGNVLDLGPEFKLARLERHSHKRSKRQQDRRDSSNYRRKSNRSNNGRFRD